MHFGEALEEDRLERLVGHAYRLGVRTFLTADVYGRGAADEMIGRALGSYPRDSYCLVGAVGHDWYEGVRDGARGFQRFTHPDLREPARYADYIKFATDRSLQRCRTSRFDLLLLHNPDRRGYTSEEVWKGMQAVKEEGMAGGIGIAPGPANGFTLDLILCLERFGPLIDQAMIILNPLEPWPGRLALPAARRHKVDLITRVVDHGGLFHDDVRPGHEFPASDHRNYRPQGWVEAGREKMEAMRGHARRRRLTMLQLACLWNLSQDPVRTVVPTLIQEAGQGCKSIEEKLEELARLPSLRLDAQEVEEIAALGANQGCMKLKGGSPDFQGEELADGWTIGPELEEVAQDWDIDPARDLACLH